MAAHHCIVEEIPVKGWCVWAGNWRPVSAFVRVMCVETGETYSTGVRGLALTGGQIDEVRRKLRTWCPARHVLP